MKTEALKGNKEVSVFMIGDFSFPFSIFHFQFSIK